MLVGLVAFMGWLRNRHRGLARRAAERRPAGEPVVMMLTFSFMSDVPLMVWLIVALACLRRGIAA